MAEQIAKKSSLMGQVIEDLSYAGVDPQRLRVEIVGLDRPAWYKEGGFFAFNEVPPGQYRVLISGERLQPQEFDVALPLADPLLGRAGDDELFVVVRTVSASDGKITFDPVVIRKAVRAGAAARAAGFTSKLAAALEPGKVSGAKLESVQGLAVGAVLRLVRGVAIRMKFDPYFRPPPGWTQLVGRVEHKNLPGRALPGAQVRIRKVNGVDVQTAGVAGVSVATVEIAGKQVVLGTDRDVKAVTNGKGDYCLYFNRGDITAVTLTASLLNYKTKNQNVSVVVGGRSRADIFLERS
ncbi:MAG TPA: hypothetical protein VF591_04290 [Pyrinomonadaceae bacterium]|jgi:hypothetical protein